MKRSDTYERLHPLTDHNCYNPDVFECGELLLSADRRWDVFKGYRVIQRFEPYDEFDSLLKSMMPKALCNNGKLVISY